MKGQEKKAQNTFFDNRIGTTTDIATWFLFHPNDLEHRLKAPSGWDAYKFAVAQEFEDGTMIAVRTRRDGFFSVRMTNKKPTDRELKYSRSKAQFRINVKHGRLFLGDARHMPSGDRWDRKELVTDKKGWTKIPNGKYIVTVHSFAWEEEPGAVGDDGYSTDKSLPNYCAYFESVEQWGNVEVPDDIPYVLPYKLPPAKPRKPKAKKELKREEWRKIVIPNVVVFPGVERDLKISQEQHEMVSEERLDLLIVNSENAKAGVLFQYSYLSGPRKKVARDGTVTQIRGPICGGVGKLIIDVEKFKRLHSTSEKISDSEIKRLRTLFRSYGKSNQYFRSNVKYPDFELDRVDAIFDQFELINQIATHIDAPFDTKTNWLLLPLAKRAQALAKFLSEAE